jgi:NitT/TauT family transport system permease protein
MLVGFGVGFLMKVVLAGLAVFFVSFGQATRGTREARDYEAVLRAMGATKGDIFRIVVIPGSLGWVFNSLRLSIGLALLGAFIGEFISSSAGLGYVLLRASSLYAVGRAIAAGLCIVGLAILFDWIAGRLEAFQPHIAQGLSVSPEFRR